MKNNNEVKQISVRKETTREEREQCENNIRNHQKKKKFC